MPNVVPLQVALHASVLVIHFVFHPLEVAEVVCASLQEPLFPRRKEIYQSKN